MKKALVKSKSRKGTGVLLDDGQWYNGTKEQLENISWKDEVEYDADDSRTLISIKKVEGDSGGGKAQSNSKPASGGKGGYNDEKRQAVIVFQSARNTATDLVTAALAAGALALPAKNADKFDCLQALVDTLTTRYFNENMEVYRNGELPEGFGDA